jgi:hypothetical protein
LISFRRTLCQFGDSKETLQRVGGFFRTFFEHPKTFNLQVKPSQTATPRNTSKKIFTEDALDGSRSSTRFTTKRIDQCANWGRGFAALPRNK